MDKQPAVGLEHPVKLDHRSNIFALLKKETEREKQVYHRVELPAVIKADVPHVGLKKIDLQVLLFGGPAGLGQLPLVNVNASNPVTQFCQGKRMATIAAGNVGHANGRRQIKQADYSSNFAACALGKALASARKVTPRAPVACHVVLSEKAPAPVFGHIDVRNWRSLFLNHAIILKLQGQK